MYDDSFKKRYKIAPVAIYQQSDFFPTYAHIHNELEILYITEGKAKLKISDYTIIANAGDIVFVNPLEVHSIEPHKTEKYSHKCICFDALLIADEKIRKRLLSGKVKISWLTKNDENIQKLFISIFDAVKNGENTLLFESSAYISLIFSHLIKNNLLIEKETKDKNEVFCQKVIEFISNNYNKQITSNDIAEKFFYTQSYFCRVFSNNFGVSFSNYLNMYRISMAKMLLENTDKKITDISYECGFLNPEYFTKCFKKHIGVLPSNYKKCQCSSKNMTS